MLLDWERKKVVYDRIYGVIYDCLTGPEGTKRGWLYENLDSHRLDPEKYYVSHFNDLCSNIVRKEKQHHIEARLRFVDADYNGMEMMTYYAYMNQADLGIDSVAWAVLWASRGRATRTKNLDDHISRSDFLSHPMLSYVASQNTIKRWLDGKIKSGRCVQILNSTDKRAKWVSLSVPALLNMWVERLSWFLVRMVCVDGEGTSSIRGNLRLWVDDLYMPEDFFYLARGHRDDLDCFRIRQ